MKRRILLVDDEMAILLTLKAILEMNGFEVETADSAGNAIKKLSNAEYNMVITDLQGQIVEGNLRPSSDLATHLSLYQAFRGVGGVVHTHSRYATAWSTRIHCTGVHV